MAKCDTRHRQLPGLRHGKLAGQNTCIPAFCAVYITAAETENLYSMAQTVAHLLILRLRLISHFTTFHLTIYFFAISLFGTLCNPSLFGTRGGWRARGKGPNMTNQIKLKRKSIQGAALSICRGRCTAVNTMCYAPQRLKT